MKRARNRTSSKNRLGFSLVELLITITLGGAVMAMGLGTLHLLLRTDKTLAESLWRSQTVSKLSQTFRRDVRSARDVKIEQPENPAAANEPAPAVLSLELDEDHQVQYAVEGEQLVRTETQADKTLQTERFRFAPGTEISLEAGEASRAAVVIRSVNSPSVKRHAPQHPVPRRELRIEAAAGRDHRFEQNETE